VCVCVCVYVLCVVLCCVVLCCVLCVCVVWCVHICVCVFCFCVYVYMCVLFIRMRIPHQLVAKQHAALLTQGVRRVRKLLHSIPALLAIHPFVKAFNSTVATTTFFDSAFCYFGLFYYDILRLTVSNNFGNENYYCSLLLILSYIFILN